MEALTFEVVKMKACHLPQVLDIERRVFAQPWSETDFLDCITESDRHYFCAVSEAEVLGYCGYWGVFEEAQIFNVAVREDARNRGIGKALLKKMIEFGIEDGRSRFILEVRTGNMPAIALYRGLGFVEDGIRPDFYENPMEDALLMSFRTD